MFFNKFIPSYHHHFGYQCKVSDYGFTKLIELFEAIPDVVEVITYTEHVCAVECEYGNATTELANEV